MIENLIIPIAVTPLPSVFQYFKSILLRDTHRNQVLGAIIPKFVRTRGAVSFPINFFSGVLEGILLVVVFVDPALEIVAHITIVAITRSSVNIKRKKKIKRLQVVDFIEF